MQLNRLPRLQFLLPVWTVRDLGFVQQRSLHSSVRLPCPVKPKNTLSIFEELFPEESKPSEKARKPLRDDSNLKGRLKNELIQEFTTYKPVRPSPARKLDATEREGQDELEVRERRNASVLILSNASKSLSLSDFLRLSPKGAHIDGWTSGILKVIPGRDLQTLEPQGHYFILFSSEAAARAYMDQVFRLYRISKTYTPTSVTSPLPPPPGYVKDGEDLHGLMQAFTLIPSSQGEISLRILKRPFRPSIYRMIAQGGHPSISARQSKADAMVLFSLDSGYIGIYELRNVLGQDGKIRNLQWTLQPGDDDIIQLASPKDVIAVDSERHGDGEERRRRRRAPPRFIISFKDNHEARRFVREWHRRPFLINRERQPEDEPPPMANAELLW